MRAQPKESEDDKAFPDPLGHPDRRDHVDYKAKPEWREGMERLVRAAATVNVA